MAAKDAASEKLRLQQETLLRAAALAKQQAQEARNAERARQELEREKLRKEKQARTEAKRDAATSQPAAQTGSSSTYTAAERRSAAAATASLASSAASPKGSSSSFLDARALARDSKTTKGRGAAIKALAKDGLVITGKTTVSAEWERRMAAKEWEDLPGPEDPVSLAAKRAGRRAVTGESHVGEIKRAPKSKRSSSKPPQLTAAEASRLKALEPLLEPGSPVMKLSIDGEMALKRALRQRDAQLLRLCLSVEPAKEVLTSAVNETSLNLSAKEECARLCVGRSGVSLLEEEQREGREFAKAASSE